MEGPRPWGTALWITVSPVPGKYALAAVSATQSRPPPGEAARGTAPQIRGPPFPGARPPPRAMLSPVGLMSACKFQWSALGVAAPATSGQGRRRPSVSGQRDRADAPRTDPQGTGESADQAARLAPEYSVSERVLAGRRGPGGPGRPEGPVDETLRKDQKK